MDLKEIIGLINLFKTDAKKYYKADVIGVFGSFVRGEEKEVSDIDVLVDFGADADLFDFVGLSIFLEEKLGRRVDIVPRDSVRPELKEQIFKEVVAV